MAIAINIVIFFSLQQPCSTQVASSLTSILLKSDKQYSFFLKKKSKGHWHRTDPLWILISFLPTFLLFMNIKIQKTTYQLPIYWYQIWADEGSIKGKRLQLTGFSAFIVFTLEGGHSLDTKLFQHLWTCQGAGKRASIIKLILNPLQWYQEDGISWKLFMGQNDWDYTHICEHGKREKQNCIHHSSKQMGETAKMLS